MAIKLPPPPIQENLPPVIKEWLNKLYQFVGGVSGQIGWGQINTAGAELSDIPIRPHSQLQGVSGSTDQFHVASAHFNELQRQDIVTTVSVNTTLTDNHCTVVVDTTGKTITLPAASTARIGKEWTIIQSIDGYVDITVSGSDTFILDGTSTTVRLDTKGASVTFRCLTATTWGIV